MAKQRPCLCDRAFMLPSSEVCFTSFGLLRLPASPSPLPGLPQDAPSARGTVSTKRNPYRPCNRTPRTPAPLRVRRKFLLPNSAASYVLARCPFAPVRQRLLGRLRQTG